jgi:hypothetical protein
MTLFSVVWDINDWYKNWALVVIVDKSFLEIELYRTKGLFQVRFSSISWLGSSSPNFV